jgi:hypothetical protein
MKRAITFSLALAAWAVVSSASMLYMQAGMRGLHAFGKWWWWNYLGLPHMSDSLANSAALGFVAFALVLLFSRLVAWRFRRVTGRALYGVTDWTTDEQTEGAGFRFTKR